MLRRFLLVALLLIAGAAQAQTPATEIAAGDRATIRQIITDQIAAFRRDDGPGAFAYASPMIQNMFGTPELFMDMVRNGYPPVYRPQRFEFARLVWMDGQLTQLVDIVGPDGIAVTAAYAMELQPNGVWRINGCRLLRPRDQSA
jgi:hypothetical protein